MILKKLILSGFKSFCDKTEFAFDRGVTCIVGPNGCGKSNVVDAVKWVVGEQSAKSLRGGQMLDMIFNGSATRRSSGVAQVDLVFDNSDHRFNLDHSEVVISRQLYRSGESTYLINSTPCRLKDVRELLLDTGVGMSAYSIIEQGKVDLMLRSNPVERRAIFEEAAGISKYKIRCKEAQRKLERTQQNLLRLQDLLDELEQRLRKIKSQATKARQYQDYDRRLRELRASTALADYHRLRTNLTELERELAGLGDRRAESGVRLSRLEAEASTLSVSTLELDQQIDARIQEQSTLKSEISGTAERRHAAQQRREEQSELLASSGQRLEREQQRAAGLREKVIAEQARLPEITGLCGEQARIVEERRAAEQELARRITALEARRDDEKSGLIDLLRQSADLHNELMGLDHQRETLRDRKDRLESRDGEIQELLKTVLNRKAVAELRVAAIDNLIQREREQLDLKRQRAAELSHRRQAAAEELAALKAQRQGLLAEQAVLQDLEDRMEGVDQAVRELLSRKAVEPDNPRLAAVHGMVADLVTTDGQNAVVVEAALERWSQHLVVQDSAAFLAINGELGELRGRLRLLCADRLNPILEPRSFAGQPGVVGRALDVVRYPESLEYLVRHLLGRVVVVQTREHALRLAREDAHGYEFVTLSGERISSGGEMVLGGKPERTGLISRKTRLREMGQQVAEVDASIEQLATLLNRQQAEAAHLDGMVLELGDSIAKNLADRAQNTAALNHAVEELARLNREQPLISSEVQILEAQIRQAVEAADLRHKSLDALRHQNSEREAMIGRSSAQAEQLHAERLALAEELTAARVQAGQLAEKKAALESTLHSLQSTLESAERSEQEFRTLISQCQERIHQADATIRDASAAVEALTRDLQQHEQGTLQLRARRETLRLSAEQLAEHIKGARGEISGLDETLHARQLNLQEAQIRLQELCARVADELGVSLQEAYAGYEHQDERDWQAIEEEIRTLREKLARLGPINLEAIAEQTELEQRLQFLLTQRNDLEDSRRQLEEIIERLNSESRERFTRTFEEIRGHFQELFRKLFGGGKADLVIDSACPDVLEAGIDVLARPPGKELQSISLMSGGEKTLTAIALLLGMFRCHPSPFVFLDEVDAALDESNNERFNRIVGEFLEQSQFIIITHSKRTMHIADVLYGVTMQEPGVSRQVTVKFEDRSAAAEPAVA
jgi:chromosome segregation protein